VAEEEGTAPLPGRGPSLLLLLQDTHAKLDLREDPTKGVYVDGLTQASIEAGAVTWDAEA
jgi:hypothetical protein